MNRGLQHSVLEHEQMQCSHWPLYEEWLQELILELVVVSDRGFLPGVCTCWYWVVVLVVGVSLFAPWLVELGAL